MSSKSQYVKNEKGFIIQKVVNDGHLKHKCKICLVCCNIPSIEARAIDDKFEGMKDFSTSFECPIILGINTS